MNAANEITSEGIIVQAGVTGAAIAFFTETIRDMVPYLFAALVLIIVDLYFGIKAAGRRSERIRPSRAVRRTVGKCFEYLCWVTVSATLSVAFDIQAIEWVILGVVMGNEVISITSNWFEVHGKTIKGLNIWKIVGDKANIDLSDVTVEDIEKEEKDGNDK